MVQPITSSSPAPATLKTTSLLFLSFIGLSLTAYLGLTVSFDFPDILRRDPKDILFAFQQQETAIRFFYSLFAFAHCVFIAAVLALYKGLSPAQSPLLIITTAGGVLYGLAQAAGFLRWPFLMPFLVDIATAADIPLAQRRLAFFILEAFHRYIGVAIGEYLSFLGFSLWLIGLSVLLQPLFPTQKIFRFLWVGAGFMVFLYSFEQFGGVFTPLAPLLLLSHGLAYGVILALAWHFWSWKKQQSCARPLPVSLRVAISLFCAALIVPGFL